MVKKLTLASLMSVLLASYASASYSSFAAETLRSQESPTDPSSAAYKLSSITWWWE